MNTFKRLHRWASGQDENFTTESLLTVLDRLLEKAPIAGLALIQAIVGKEPGISLEDIPYLEIRTQSTYDSGRPDFEIIKRDDIHIMVEVKVESPLGTKQLSGYRKDLAKCTENNKHLALLTNYTKEIPPGEEADYYSRWFNVGECLKEQLKTIDTNDHITHYLIEQFVEFLKERGMTTEIVGWELGRGIRAWLSLQQMIYQALSRRDRENGKAVRVPKTSVEADWGGYYTNSQWPRVLIGIHWKAPGILRCDTNRLRVENAPNDFGEKISDKFSPGGQKWTAALDLESEDVHFFARSLAGQKAVIEEFVDKCVKATEDLPDK